RDPADTVTAGDPPQDLELAIRKVLLRAFVLLDRERGDEAADDFRARVALAAPRSLYRRQQLVGRALLRQIAARARLEHAQRILLLRIHRQRQHRERRLLALQLLQQVEPGAAGHRNVE